MTFLLARGLFSVCLHLSIRRLFSRGGLAALLRAFAVAMCLVLVSGWLPHLGRGRVSIANAAVTTFLIEFVAQQEAYRKAYGRYDGEMRPGARAVDSGGGVASVCEDVPVTVQGLKGIAKSG